MPAGLPIICGRVKCPDKNKLSKTVTENRRKLCHGTSPENVTENVSDDDGDDDDDDDDEDDDGDKNINNNNTSNNNKIIRNSTRWG